MGLLKYFKQRLVVNDDLVTLKKADRIALTTLGWLQWVMVGFGIYILAQVISVGSELSKDGALGVVLLVLCLCIGCLIFGYVYNMMYCRLTRRELKALKDNRF